MTDQTFRFPRFFVTAPSPCPYIPGKIERKIFTELRGTDATELNEALTRIGFRRSQNVVYRPSCDDCQACVSVRVPTKQFQPSTTQRKLLRRNADLVVTACRAWSTQEQFDLLQSYLRSRHPEGGMTGMDSFDYADMVEQTPVDSLVVEYREPADPATGRPGKLVGACLTDRHGDGLSMVYSFYDAGPEARRGLGTFIVLDHIVRAAEDDLPFVYLGYWIEGGERMDYKSKFRPAEKLTRAGWRPIIG